MFTCVYLSETGVGQTVAERLHAESGAHGLQCRLHSAEHFREVKDRVLPDRDLCPFSLFFFSSSFSLGFSLFSSQD